MIVLAQDALVFKKGLYFMFLFRIQRVLTFFIFASYTFQKNLSRSHFIPLTFMLAISNSLFPLEIKSVNFERWRQDFWGNITSYYRSFLNVKDLGLNSNWREYIILGKNAVLYDLFSYFLKLWEWHKVSVHRKIGVEWSESFETWQERAKNT